MAAATSRSGLSELTRSTATGWTGPDAASAESASLPPRAPATTLAPSADGHADAFARAGDHGDLAGQVQIHD
jgi:hypothetical protein